jgi:hypothetical protein
MLDWLTNDSWTKGAIAKDYEMNEISCTSVDAEYFDLFGALYISRNWRDIDSFYSKIEDIKKIYKLIQPAKYKEAKAEGDTSLSGLNDRLENFGQVKQLLAMLEL